MRAGGRAFRMPQGQRGAGRGARCWAMTEIGCRRTETLFRYSFWVGRWRNEFLSREGREGGEVAERRDDNSPAIYGWVKRQPNGTVPRGTAEWFFRPCRDFGKLRTTGPSHEWLGYSQRGVERTCSRTPQLYRLFSGIHFGMDDWGERARLACSFGRRARNSWTN